MYVVIEGIDGCGKSSQRKHLAERLDRLGYTCVTFYEPSYGTQGAEIRQLIATDTEPSRDIQLDLFTRDRIEHVRIKINPMLAFMATHSSFVILQERSYLSYPAYQGRSISDCLPMLEQHQRIAPTPDIFIYLDLPVSNAVQRIQNRGGVHDAFETEQRLIGVLERYRWLVKYADESIVALNADQNEDVLAERVFEAVQPYLPYLSE